MELRQTGTAIGFLEPTDREKLDKLLDLKKKLVRLPNVNIQTYRDLLGVEKAVRGRIERQERNSNAKSPA